MADFAHSDLVPAESMSDDLASRTATLSVYAVTFRYPDDDLPVENDEYETAVQVASDVYQWATEKICLADINPEGGPMMYSG